MHGRPVPTEGSVLQPEAAARLVQNLHGFAVACSILLGALALSAGDTRLFVLSASGFFAFGALFFLARAGRVSLSGALGSAYLMALVLVAMVTGYGIRDLSLPMFAFIILLSNLVLPERLGGWMTWSTWAILVGAGVAEHLGVFSTPMSSRTTVFALVLLALTNLAVALTARRLVLAFHGGIRRAHVQELSYSHIFNATGEAICLIDPASERIIDVNQSAETMFGYSRAELLRFSLQQLAGKQESVEPVITMLGSGADGEPLLFDWKVTTKENSELPVEVSLGPAVVGARNVVLAVVRDASEKRRIEAKLQESEKLQAVGQLAGGIAHDFNNQLTGILANASILQEKIDDPRLSKCVEVIMRCSRRSSDLTSQLLAFARRGKHQNVAVDLHELVGEVVELLKHSIDKRITLDTYLAGEELQVLGDPTLLQNALLNLGLNACDAMPQGGTLSFRTGLKNVETTQTGVSTQVRHGEYALVEVSDTGHGMDEATQKRVFEPFFTTKQSGNGMGLAAVYGAVESHRGDISFSSAPGLGTTFSILLPLCTQRKRESVTIKLRQPTMQFNGLRVLLADDEDDVARTTKLLLENLGCKVTRCKDGKEAVETFNTYPEDFDLALLDHMMPKLSGREVLKKLREVRAQLPILLTSGYSTETVIEGEHEAQDFLPKPFSAAQLSASLARVLEASDSELAQASDSEGTVSRDS